MRFKVVFRDKIIRVVGLRSYFEVLYRIKFFSVVGDLEDVFYLF